MQLAGVRAIRLCGMHQHAAQAQCARYAIGPARGAGACAVPGRTASTVAGDGPDDVARECESEDASELSGGVCSVSARRRSSTARSTSSSCWRPRRAFLGSRRGRRGSSRCRCAVWGCGRRGNPAAAPGSAAATPATTPVPLLGSAGGALRNSGSDLVGMQMLRSTGLLVTVRGLRGAVGPRKRGADAVKMAIKG